MFCSKCGTENGDDNRFCKKCGAALGSSGVNDDLTRESATGLEPNVAGLLCYGLGWLTGIVFWILEKEEQFVRFHAMQSIVVFGTITIIQIGLWIFAWIPYIGFLFWILSVLVGLGTLALWVFLMLKAYQGERYKLPYAGEFAERFL